MEPQLKPNWRGLQLFRRANWKMTNMLNNCKFAIARFHSATFVWLDFIFTSHSIAIQWITATGRFFIFSFLNLNILHTKFEVLKKPLQKVLFWRILFFYKKNY